MPDYVVTTTGEFVGVHDLPAFQTKLRAFLLEFFPKDVDSNILPQVQALFSSEAFLNSRAAEQWNAVVGAWAGAELELGAEYTYSSKEPVPLFPGEQVLMNYSFSAKRLVPCHRSGVDRSCAELEMRSTADPEDTKRMIQSFLSSVVGKTLPQTPSFGPLRSRV